MRTISGQHETKRRTGCGDGSIVDVAAARDARTTVGLCQRQGELAVLHHGFAALHEPI